MNRILAILLLSSLGKIPGVMGQEVFGAAPNPSAGLPAPRDISASDGVYDKFVLVRWTPGDLATQYRVMRGNSPSAATLQEVSNAWQKSTWLCDYSALPGVIYHYTVIASNGKEQSVAGSFDKGYVKLKDPVASDGRSDLSGIEAYGASQKAFLLVSSVEVALENRVKAGDSVLVSVEAQNVFEQTAPRTELRYFLSRDAILDWYDVPLGVRILSEVKPGVRISASDRLVIPTATVPGLYHLLVASSANAEVLSSKIEQTTLTIQK